MGYSLWLLTSFATLFIVVAGFSFGSALVSFVTLPLDDEGSHSSVLLGTPPLDVKGSQSSVLLVTPLLDANKSQSSVLLVTPHAKVSWSSVKAPSVGDSTLMTRGVSHCGHQHCW